MVATRVAWTAFGYLAMRLDVKVVEVVKDEVIVIVAKAVGVAVAA